MSSRPVTTRHTLHPHPVSGASGRSLVADVTCAGDRVHFAFHLAAGRATLRVPAPAAARRADGLWRHTCFEAFVGLPPGEGYLEYNFSPSGAWAAYRFAGYRAGMAPLEDGAPPQVQCEAAEHGLELRATVDLGWMEAARGQVPGALRLGLTAVIEDQAGLLSYWALAHASEKPDFHRVESFVAALS
jgi:hypothetical protein